MGSHKYTIDEAHTCMMETITWSEVQDSPLLKLPAELRNRIYELVLVHPYPLIVVTPSEDDADKTFSLNLLHTCRAIREEASSIVRKAESQTITLAVTTTMRLKHCVEFERHAVMV